MFNIPTGTSQIQSLSYQLSGLFILKVNIRNYLSSSFPIALSPLLLIFSLEYAIRKVQETRLRLDMNGINQILPYADDVNLQGDDTVSEQ